MEARGDVEVVVVVAVEVAVVEVGVGVAVEVVAVVVGVAGGGVDDEVEGDVTVVAGGVYVTVVVDVSIVVVEMAGVTIAGVVVAIGKAVATAGAVRRPGGTISDFPAPSEINSLILASVLGPMAPTVSICCFSWNFFTAASVRGPK